MAGKSGSTVVEDPVLETEKREDDRTDGSGPRIRCPLCNWSPGKDALWRCSCGHSWNTFDTGGVCPSCLFQWKTTQCLACGKWSAHSDWYGE